MYFIYEKLLQGEHLNSLLQTFVTLVCLNPNIKFIKRCLYISELKFKLEITITRSLNHLKNKWIKNKIFDIVFKSCALCYSEFKYASFKRLYGPFPLSAGQKQLKSLQNSGFQAMFFWFTYICNYNYEENVKLFKLLKRLILSYAFETFRIRKYAIVLLVTFSFQSSTNSIYN